MPVLLLIAAGAEIVLGPAYAGSAGPLAAVDVISRPAATRVFLSPAGHYELTVSSADNWRTPRGVAELAEISGNERRLVWRQDLPHRMGPRTAVVTDSGTVVLIDEWINSPSPYALTVIDSSGKILAQYSLDQLIAALGVERRAISANARLGIWMSAAPVLSADGAAIIFRTGGRRLTVWVSDGRLSVAD